jgi:hypothetical protein
MFATIFAFFASYWRPQHTSMIMVSSAFFWSINKRATWELSLIFRNSSPRYQAAQHFPHRWTPSCQARRLWPGKTGFHGGGTVSSNVRVTFCIWTCLKIFNGDLHLKSVFRIRKIFLRIRILWSVSSHYESGPDPTVLTGISQLSWARTVL